MEVDQEISLLSSGKASVDVALHPLVLMNVSEHFSRVRAQSGNPDTQVFGAILGTLDGRKVEVFNSFELVVSTTDDGSWVADEEYFTEKSEQFVQVFKNLDLLGWYTTGARVTAHHVAFQKQIMQRVEAPLLLLLNPFPSPASRDLPIHIFESVIELNEAQQALRFIDINFILATEEAERIGVDHIARVSTATARKDVSEVSLHLQSQFNAIQMLHERVAVILKYLTAVKAGAFEPNHEILRSISALCSRLPVTNSSDFDGVFIKDTSDVLLTSYLASITKGCDAANQLLDKFTHVHDRFGSSRRTGRFL